MASRRPWVVVAFFSLAYHLSSNPMKLALIIYEAPLLIVHFFPFSSRQFKLIFFEQFQSHSEQLREQRF